MRKRIVTREPPVDPVQLGRVLLKLPRVHYRVLRGIIFHLRRYAPGMRDAIQDA